MEKRGNNLFIGLNVSIGQNCIIGNNVCIHDDTIIGGNVRIDDNAVIGKLPLRSINSATTTEKELNPTKIANGTLIGTSAIIYRGSTISKNCLIADSASIRENVSIGEKTIIGRNTTIENNVKIGSYCKLQSNVQIVPYSIIEDCVFISPGVITSNDSFVGRTKERLIKFKGVTIKKGARIGVAAVTLPGVVINEDALVAAGALVTKDVPSKKIVMGIPARVVGDVPDNQLLLNQK